MQKTNKRKDTHLSYSFNGPRGKTSSAPPLPNRTFDAKNGSSVTYNIDVVYVNKTWNIIKY